MRCSSCPFKGGQSLVYAFPLAAVHKTGSTLLDLCPYGLPISNDGEGPEPRRFVVVGGSQTLASLIPYLPLYGGSEHPKSLRIRS